MRLVMTLLCRDEADIIASTIRFHLDRGVDHLIVTDNGSVDGSREIVAGFLGSGRVSLLDEPTHNHDQAAWVSRMAEIAYCKHSADWLIHGDADEFWWPQCGDLKIALEMISDSTEVVRVMRSNFLPPETESDTADGEAFHVHQCIRERRSCNALGYPLPAKVCHRAGPQLQITDGNHRVLRGGNTLDARDCNTIEILHFPIRSYRQFERKIKHGAQALLRNQRVSPQVGSTWRNLYQDFYCTGRLREYYQSLRPPADQVQQQLNSGELLLDRRLHEALSHAPT